MDNVQPNRNRFDRHEAINPSASQTKIESIHVFDIPV